MKEAREISIRPQQVKDAKEFYRILTSGGFSFFPVNVASIEAEKRFLRRSCEDFKAGRNYNFAIICDGKVIGAVGIMPESSRPYNAEIGYFIDRDYHGQGIAFKAACLAESYVKANLPTIQRLQAFIVVDNHPSRRVVEKADFRQEGVLKNYLKIGEYFFDACIYGKVIR